MKLKLEFITPNSNAVQIDKAVQIIHNKNSRKNKKIFKREEYEKTELVWNLKKHIGESADDGFDWVHQSSNNELNEELTAEKIVEILNGENKFDFDYLPEENDYLAISFRYCNPVIKGKTRPLINNCITFLFNNGKWKINSGYDHIDMDFAEFKNGIIKYVAQHQL